jgi:MFS family permease
LTLASDATMHEPHGVAMAVYRVFGDAGYVVGPIMVGALSDMYGLRTPFYAVAILILVSTTLIQIFAKETLVKKKKTEAPSAEAITRVE